MSLEIKYINDLFVAVGVRKPDIGETIIDEILKGSYLNAEICGCPNFNCITVSISNYSGEFKYYSYALHIYSINPIYNRAATPIESELWNSYIYNYRKKFESTTDLKESGKLPKDLQIGQYRLDTLDNEIFFEIWIPLSQELKYGLLENILRTLDCDISPYWEKIQSTIKGVISIPTNIEKSKSSTIFLCHSSHDKPFVRKLRDDLRSRGLKIWYDEEQILAGNDFLDKIENGIAESKFVIVVLSNNFVKYGPFAKEELKSAFAKQIQINKTKVIPVLLDDCEIPFFLKTKAYADFRMRFEDGLNYLVHSILNQ